MVLILYKMTANCKDIKQIFPDITKGDTFTGAKMTFYNGTGDTKTPMDLAGASIIINFKRGEGQNPVFTFKKENCAGCVGNTITIPDPETGEVYLQPRVMNYPAFNYIFDIQVTHISGTILTYLKGYWRVCQDV